MIKKTELTSDKLPVMGFPWALSVTGASQLVFVSGVPPMNEMRKVVISDAYDQFIYELERIKEILATADMGLGDIVYLTVTVTEKAYLYENWNRFVEIWARYFPERPGPAGGTLRIVSGLSHPKMMVEVEAIAAR
jgi:enamine deaminase RidA (YjgF/YER057c/UK114 family)